MVELRQLRYFIAVAEELNFSRAAARLHMAQPPLSQQIRALETELGVCLFDRKRPLQLTAAGVALLDSARLAVAQVELAVQLTRRIDRGEVGRLTVGFTSSIANSILPDILRSFRSQFPDVELVWQELATYAQIQGLRDRLLDVGFFHLPPRPAELKDLQFFTLRSETLLLVLPHTHPLSDCAAIPLSALSHEAFVLPLPQFAPGIADAIEQLCQRSHFVPKVTQTATFMLTILGLVAGGVGVSLLPANAENLQRRGVIYKPILGETQSVAMAIVWRQDDNSAIVQQFIEVTKMITRQP